MSLLKRKLTLSGGRRKELTDEEQVVYNVIRSRENMGILKAELKRECKGIKDRAFTNCIKSLLLEKNKIKEVKSKENKKVYLMALEFEASTELTGGAWYNEGDLDTAFVEGLAQYCLGMIRKRKVATVDQVYEQVKACKAFTGPISAGQIAEILKTLVLDNEIMKVKSSGSGVYESIPEGMVCYRISRKVQALAGASSKKAEETPTPAMVSMPCGSCPRINQCTPNGAISPITCVYYNEWLNF